MGDQNQTLMIPHRRRLPYSECVKKAKSFQDSYICFYFWFLLKRITKTKLATNDYPS